MAGKRVLVDHLGTATKELRKYKLCHFVKGLRHIFAAMKRIAALFACLQLALLGGLGLGGPLLAQEPHEVRSSARTVSTYTYVEEWDPAQGRWVRVDAEEATSVSADESMPTVVKTLLNGEIVSQARSAARYAQPIPASPRSEALAQYGPFVVTSATRAKMVGSTNSHTPGQFDAMLRDFPGIATLEMVEAPGTSNDIANLAVGRKIRSAGIATHVPRGGSVRSGAVELFLAGTTRSIEDGAEFAVHSWLDNYGREADDFAANHPAHRLYLDYYVEMGMSESAALAFYSMTNSVPHASARWLKADEMRGWIAPQRYAARELARCTVCERVDGTLAETQRLAGALHWEELAQGAIQPAIGYGDVTQINIVRLNASLLDVSVLDASVLDSGVAFP